MIRVSSQSYRNWVHHGRSDTLVNANANSDNSLANFSHQISNKKLRTNSLVNANGFARKFLANGRLRQKLLAIANAMAWCTQYRHMWALIACDQSAKIRSFQLRDHRAAWSLSTSQFHAERQRFTRFIASTGNKLYGEFWQCFISSI